MVKERSERSQSAKRIQYHTEEAPEGGEQKAPEIQNIETVLLAAGKAGGANRRI